MQDFQRQLIDLVYHLFQLTVDELLPIGESFASEVIRFRSGDKHYVLKRPFTLDKAQREFHWLEKLAHLSFVPDAYGFAEQEDQGYILMASLPGMPLSNFSDASCDQLQRIGQDMRQLHDVAADDFDGYDSWHRLLKANVERYIATIDGPQRELAQQAVDQFITALQQLPDSHHASAVHFDLRAGNILFEQNRYSAIIDFEAMRGGHPSMDFFKFLASPSDLSDTQLDNLLQGYGAVDWLHSSEQLRAMVNQYQIYHGLAGLAWCSSRQIASGDFYQRCVRFLLDGLHPSSALQADG
ncbi:hypothetical protein CHH28_03765 [Bacterioplanes sanyensis]|uniref:Aminoglycoside phosphotransferase domain-containing protein n=1 Tax=Bacterioplanes sanyensis TaxID=1249553 RepID=A0A222FH80_9GAMM|nr:aminoglycoside phosphotransferase family protein [Bacterioplanes sanyensis]ASP37844.1 hypothetical protein CHH28_03765 [Bacterioplanes sanyensis]